MRTGWWRVGTTPLGRMEGGRVGEREPRSSRVASKAGGSVCAGSALRKPGPLSLTCKERVREHQQRWTGLTAVHARGHCTVLHCTALHCIALHCIALYCIAVHGVHVRSCQRGRGSIVSNAGK